MAGWTWTYVTFRDAGGRRLWDVNATAWIGADQYEERIAVLRSGLGDGMTLDTAVADALHRRTRIARRRYHAAMMRWMSAGAPTGQHPGDLADWMPAA